MNRKSIYLPIVEETRIKEQFRLDSLKTPLERNKLGQFATPPELALSIAKLAKSLIDVNSGIRFIDPALGTGSFFSAVLKTFSPGKIKSATGVEIDSMFAETAQSLWADKGLNVITGDFTRMLPPEVKYNLLIANPPYIRHHHLDPEIKNRLKSLLKNSANSEISGLAGLYCYFLLLCHDWMEDGGIAIWLMPSEFMDVNYGKAVRRYLAEDVTLLQLHRFSPTDVQFADALVSSAVVVFRKSPPTKDHQIRFSFGSTLDAPKVEKNISIREIKKSKKWTQFPTTHLAAIADGPRLADFFTIKRGLATGANDFFIIEEPQVKEYSIPRRFLKPILPGPRHLHDNIIRSLPNGEPDIAVPRFLIDCNENESSIGKKWPDFYRYLSQGRSAGVSSSYLVSRRTPWYSQEQRLPAPFLCNYMGRTKDANSPFRFLWNQSKATAHNVYLLLYPKGILATLLNSDPELHSAVFKTLKSITSTQLLTEGRIYGGGLHKIEPKELGNVFAGSFVELLQNQDFRTAALAPSLLGLPKGVLPKTSPARSRKARQLVQLRELNSAR